MSKIRVETYFKNEIMNYEEQDKKAGRDVEDVDYVYRCWVFDEPDEYPVWEL